VATDPFHDVVSSEDELCRLVGRPSELALRKEIAELDHHCRAFIAQSPFLLLATADAAGRCDVSPKGDAPGFALVLGARHLAIPDRPGNRRLDGMRNLLENPHVGLIFLVPGQEETLRVNGRAWIVRDGTLLDRMRVAGKRPQLAIGVEVEACFFHCAKAFKRSGLWHPGTWPDPSGLAPAAQVLFDQAQPPGATVEDVAERLRESYTRRLY
jgi:PPOX class probable FMN-dependent enzyme